MYLSKNGGRGSDAVFSCKKGVVFVILTRVYAGLCRQLCRTA